MSATLHDVVSYQPPQSGSQNIHLKDGKLQIPDYPLTKAQSAS